MAKVRLEVEGPKPVELEVGSIAELDAVVAKIVNTVVRDSIVSQTPLDAAAKKMFATDAERQRTYKKFPANLVG
jgi:hypothetical protein